MIKKNKLLSKLLGIMLTTQAIGGVFGNSVLAYTSKKKVVAIENIDKLKNEGVATKNDKKDSKDSTKSKTKTSNDSTVKIESGTESKKISSKKSDKKANKVNNEAKDGKLICKKELVNENGVKVVNSDETKNEVQNKVQIKDTKAETAGSILNRTISADGLPEEVSHEIDNSIVVAGETDNTITTANDIIKIFEEALKSKAVVNKDKLQYFLSNIGSELNAENYITNDTVHVNKLATDLFGKIEDGFVDPNKITVESFAAVYDHNTPNIEPIMETDEIIEDNNEINNDEDEIIANPSKRAALFAAPLVEGTILPITYIKEADFLYKLKIIDENPDEIKEDDKISKKQLLKWIVSALNYDEMSDFNGSNCLPKEIKEEFENIEGAKAYKDCFEFCNSNGILPIENWREGSLDWKLNPNGTIFLYKALIPCVNALGYADEAKKLLEKNGGREEEVYLQLALQAGILDKVSYNHEEFQSYNEVTKNRAIKTIFEMINSKNRLVNGVPKTTTLLEERHKMSSEVGVVQTATVIAATTGTTAVPAHIVLTLNLESGASRTVEIYQEQMTFTLPKDTASAAFLLKTPARIYSSENLAGAKEAFFIFLSNQS